MMRSDQQQSSYVIVEGGPELLDRVEPLWDQLRLHHAECDSRWADSLLARQFVERKAELCAKAAAGLRVLVADFKTHDVAYCICTMTAQRFGEVDSMFVEPQHRSNGLGTTLMTRGLSWLSQAGSTSIGVTVLFANLEAQRFYERHGFHARSVHLRHLE